MNPSLSACALELLASEAHREAGASLARALVLATELDEGTVKKLSAALVEAVENGSDPAIGALANLLARGATASPSVLSKLVATRSRHPSSVSATSRLRDAGAVVDCGAMPVLAECLGDEELRRSACAALRNVAASNPGAVARTVRRSPGRWVTCRTRRRARCRILRCSAGGGHDVRPELAVALRDAPRKAASALARAARDPADVPVTLSWKR